jgi:CheY-like chemotaxis protein
MSVLCIADSNELDQRIMKLNLLKFPIFKHVLHFYRDAELLSYLKENRNDTSNLPDVLLLDLNIQQQSQPNILESLQSLYPNFRKKPDVYIISASILPKDINKALSYEFVQDYITKPVTKDILRQIVTGTRPYVYR